jgi:hypothetical protein
MPRLASIVALLAALGCTNSGSTLSGAGAFTPNTEIGGYASLDDGGPDPSIIAVEISRVDQGTQTCAEIVDGGGRLLTGQFLVIATETGDGTPIRAGQYPIVATLLGNGSAAAVLTLGDTDAGTTAAATSGSVTLTEVGATLAGSFTSTLALLSDGGAFGLLSGTFSAQNCGFSF